MDYCNHQKQHTGPGACPGCGASSQTVKAKTIKHWLISRHVPLVPEAAFHVCKTSACPVVYFSAEGHAQYTIKDLRYTAGFKEGSGPVPVCYCFGVTDEMILKEVRETGKSTYSTWIAKEVKDGNCACDVRNPTGRCCLGEIKRVEARED